MAITISNIYIQTKTITTMGHMKQLSIDLQNEAMEQELIQKHDILVNAVNESGLPYWMYSMYDNYISLAIEQEEVESRILANPMMGYLDFTHSDEGENYHAFFGNWADAYQSYRNDKLNPL
jgi:hypothetical protein